MRSTIIATTAAALVAAFALASCGGTPRHSETRIEQVSTLVFEGGPEGASVLVNGMQVASLQKKSTTVPIADGTHQVKVMQGARVLYDRAVFIQDGTKKVIPLAQAK